MNILRNNHYKISWQMKIFGSKKEVKGIEERLRFFLLRSRGWEELRTSHESVERSWIQWRVKQRRRRRRWVTSRCCVTGGCSGYEVQLLMMMMSTAVVATVRRALTAPGGVMTVWPLVVEDSLEHMPCNVDGRLVCVLLVCLVHGAHSHAAKHSLWVHFGWELPHFQP